MDDAMEVSMRRRSAYAGLVITVGLTMLGALVPSPGAQGLVEVPLAMEKDRFVPEELKVKAGSAFILVLTNRDDITHELDIPKLRLEKKVRPGQTLKLQMPALRPGRYELVDDDSTPELHGVMVAE
jgi:heme/copper-type cytochrome/quinol oxidase subunit 2